MPRPIDAEALQGAIYNEIMSSKVPYGIEETQYFRSIISKLVNDAPTITAYPDWISTADRLPTAEEVRAFRKKSSGDYPEYNVMIKGASIPTTLYFDGGTWFGDNVAYPVTHWLPLPPALKEEETICKR